MHMGVRHFLHPDESQYAAEEAFLRKTCSAAARTSQKQATAKKKKKNTAIFMSTFSFCLVREKKDAKKQT